MNRKIEAFNTWKHRNTTKDDFRTPDYILNYVDHLMGRKITHDGACVSNNAVAEPFDLFGDKPLPDRSLLFVNPPWDTPNVKKFVKTAYSKTNTSSDCVFLLPNKMCEVSWVEEVNHLFDMIIMLGGRVNFSGPHSVKQGASRWGTFVGIMKNQRDYNSKFLTSYLGRTTKLRSVRISSLKERF